jgi:23S rRNA pseudouridine1911/1915/1917 synthase
MRQDVDFVLLLPERLFQVVELRAQPGLPHQADDRQHERQRGDDERREQKLHVVSVSARTLILLNLLHTRAQNLAARVDAAALPLVGMEPRIVIADRGDSGRRLDHVLARHLAGVPAVTRTSLQRWIREGQVLVNGCAVTRTAARTAAGDVLSVTLPASPKRAPMSAEELPLGVLFEDDHLLVLDKPAGLVVHPTYRHMAGTLMNGLLWRARDWPAGTRPSIVGRLDKLTSGIVVAAKTAAAHAALQRTMASVRTEKDYLAIVYGVVSPPRGTIELRLSRAPSDRRRVVTSADGLASTTRYERLARSRAPRAGVSLLRCRIATGRMHQIRVHLAARRWPIVGDPKYGEPRWRDVEDAALAERLRMFPRQALHAWRLRIAHPATGVELRIEAPVPEDFAALAKACGLAWSSQNRR